MALGKRKLQQDELFIRTGTGDAWEPGLLASRSRENGRENVHSPVQNISGG